MIRIFIMHPTEKGGPWHVARDGEGGRPYRTESEAVKAACDQARIFEEMGMDAAVKQESADGSWETIRE